MAATDPVPPEPAQPFDFVEDAINAAVGAKSQEEIASIQERSHHFIGNDLNAIKDALRARADELEP